ncbi:MAG: alpha-amylase/4-alpha-glucanotransferase domain-containing protein, partial [Chloroflexota bacterium]
GAPGGGAVAVRKTIEIGGRRMRPELRLTVAVRNNGPQPIRARMGLEWALMLLGGGGNPSAWYEIEGNRRAHDSAGSAAGVELVRQGNDWIGLSIESTPSQPADAWWAPIETVSNSEGGFERVYQGSSLLLSWRLDLPPGQEAVFGVTHRVAAATDRAEATAAR